MYAQIDSSYYNYDDREYERDEEENKIIAKQKRELEDNEESFDYLRENLDSLVSILSSKDQNLDSRSVDLLLASMCAELGVEFNGVVLARPNLAKDGVYLRS